MHARLLLGLMLAADIAAAQHGSRPLRVDETSFGAKLFRSQCAGCHGPDGSGTGAGPSLNTGLFRRGSSDDALVATISKGIPGTTMPAFNYDAAHMWQLVAHIRALAIVRAAGNVTGNVETGRKLFTANCAGCHTPSGAYTGPDLAETVFRLSVDDLRKSILEPDASVSSEYWSVSARTASGKVIEGVRLNEDTSSIQLRARGGKLTSVLKKDLAGFEVIRRSPMPSFAGKLSAAQIDHIIAYLIKGKK